MAVIEVPAPIIGDYMRKARKKARLSQTAVAEKLGTSQPRVSRWENGEDYPDLAEYRAFVEITGAEWLLDLGNLPSSCIAA